VIGLARGGRVGREAIETLWRAKVFMKPHRNPCVPQLVGVGYAFIGKDIEGIDTDEGWSQSIQVCVMLRFRIDWNIVLVYCRQIAGAAKPVSLRESDGISALTRHGAVTVIQHWRNQGLKGDV